MNKLNSKGSLDMRFMDVVIAYLYVIPSGFLPCLPKANLIDIGTSILLKLQ